MVCQHIGQWSSILVRRCIITLITSASSAPKGGFIHIHNYESKKSGEIAHHTINGSVSWKNTLFRALETLALVSVESIAADCKACGGDIDLARKALNEVKTSFQKSYDRLENDQGTTSNYDYLAPGVATLPDEDSLYVWGLCMHKEVVSPGVFKNVNSRPKTLVKRWIERLTPASKFRRFKLTPGTYDHVSIDGKHIS
jgi:hypothetical protein